MTTTLHPNDTACPEWCAGSHGRFPHTASFGTVVLSDEEFACRNTAAEVTLTNGLDGAPAIEFGDGLGRSRLTYRFTLTEAEQLAESLTRAIEAGRAAERHSGAAESPAGGRNGAGQGEPTLVCIDCGDGFVFDSSPSLDLCWRCDETRRRRGDDVIQLAFDGAEVETKTTAAPGSPALATAHAAVQLAESLLTAEQTRPASREHWQRLATAYECRAAAWRLLAVSWERDTSGHAIRAMELAAESDLGRARMLRGRLAVSG